MRHTSDIKIAEKKQAKPGRVIFFGILIVLFALFLRLYNLNVIPVFVDEAIYVRWAQIMKAEATLRFLPMSDGKQPLFMWVVMFILKFFEDPLAAGRFVSAIVGTGTVIGVFVLGYLLTTSFPVTLFAGLFYAISPFSVFFDRLALADSMLSFFGIWTLVFVTLGIKTRRMDLIMVSGFFLGGALLTKSPGIYFAIMTPLIIAIYSLKENIKDSAKNAFNLLTSFVPMYLIAFGMYGILRLGPNFHMIAQRNADYVYPLNHFFTSPLDPLKPFLDRSLEYFLIMGPSFIVMLIIVGLFLGMKKYWQSTLSLLIWGLLPIIISSEFSRTMTARYIYFSVPYFFLIAAMTMSDIDKKYKTILGIIAVLFGVHSTYLNYQLLNDPQAARLPRSERSGYFEDWTSGYGIKEASLYFEDLATKNPQKKIVVGTEGFFGTLPDGLQMYLNHMPEITIIGVGVHVDKIPTSLIESKAAGNRTFLLINDSRLIGDYEDKNLTLISSYPKSQKPDGTRENLLLLELNEEI